MQVSIETIHLNADRSFRAFEYAFFREDQPYHLHDEVELAAVDGTAGVVYCGAATTEFASGDLFLFGRRLPHRFTAVSGLDRRSTGAGEDSARARVVQFRTDAFGSDFFRLPENTEIRSLLRDADRGLVLRAGMEDRNPGRRILDIIAAPDHRRLTRLLTVLGDLVELRKSGALQDLAPDSPAILAPDGDTRRLAILQDYIETEYAGEVTVDGAAERLALTRTSLCRYVRKSTGLTFTALVNDYRLTIAAMLLRDRRRAVSAIAADVGFGSLSHFNGLFRRRFGCTPTEYRNAAAGSAGAGDPGRGPS